jgi:hypothetical protein
VEITELRLPSPSAIGLVVRDRTSFVPAPDTRLRDGDELLIVTTVATRDATERRLRAVGRGGRLARWYGDDGDPEHNPGHDGDAQETQSTSGRAHKGGGEKRNRTGRTGRTDNDRSPSPGDDPDDRPRGGGKRNGRWHTGRLGRLGRRVSGRDRGHGDQGQPGRAGHRPGRTEPPPNANDRPPSSDVAADVAPTALIARARRCSTTPKPSNRPVGGEVNGVRSASP